MATAKENDGADRNLSGSELAAILGLDERRIRQMVKEGLPRHGHGLYPLAACVQWYVAYWRDKAQGREGNAAKNDKLQFESQMARLKYEEAAGLAISRAEVVMAVSSMFLRLGKMLDNLPAVMVRDCSLPSDAARKMQARLDLMRADVVHDLAEYIDVVEPADAKRSRKKRA